MEEEPSLGTAITALLGVVSLVIMFVFRLRSKEKTKLPPGNQGLPFLGETLSYLPDPAGWATEKAKKFGTPFLTHVFFHPTIEVSEDDDMKWVWDSERRGLTSVCWPSHFQDMLGRKALTSISGSRHRALRRLLSPAFGPASIRDYVDIIDNTTRAELEKWASTGQFQPSVVFKEFALRILFKCIFPEMEEGALQQVRRDFPTWLDGFNSLVPYPLPGTTLAKSLAARKRLIALIRKLVEDFKEKYSSDSKEANSSLLGRMCYGTDEGNQLSVEELCDNIIVIIFAGHDTTAASMGSFLHNAFVDQRVADALTEEVGASVFKGPRMDFDELKNAPVLNAFMAESWRKDPPVTAGGGKILQEATTYKSWRFPKAMVLTYNVFLSAHNEKRYRQPELFRIERFLPATHALVTDATFCAPDVDYNAMSPAFPIFGGGSHSCIGHHFARLESRILLARMFQLYDIEVKNSKKSGFPMNCYEIDFRLTPKS